MKNTRFGYIDRSHGNNPSGIAGREGREIGPIKNSGGFHIHTEMCKKATLEGGVLHCKKTS